MRGMGDWDLTPRAASTSEVVLVELMAAEDANIMGTVHGGTVMKLVDTAAGLAAIRHCGGVAVTASIDEMSFHAPVFVGNLLHVRASINDVGRTSMEVGVRVEAENIVTGRARPYLERLRRDGCDRRRRGRASGSPDRAGDRRAATPTARGAHQAGVPAGASPDDRVLPRDVRPPGGVAIGRPGFPHEFLRLKGWRGTHHRREPRR